MSKVLSTLIPEISSTLEVKKLAQKKLRKFAKKQTYTMNKKMSKKVLLIITQPTWGGAQRHIFDLALGLKEEGFKVVVGTGKPKSSAKEDSLLIEKLREKEITTQIFSHLTRPIRPLSDIRAIFEIFSFLQKNKINILHLHSSKAGVVGAVAGFLARTPRRLFTAHGLVLNEPLPRYLHGLYYILEWISFRLSHHIITVSDFDRHIALKSRLTSPLKISTIWNGIDQKVFTTSLLPKETARRKILSLFPHSIDEKNFIIGTIAHFYKNKGLSFLVSAAEIVVKSFPQAHFVIIGSEGSERASIEQKIKECSLEKNIHLLGFIENPESLLNSFDLYVSSSLKEGLPYSLISALSAEVPIVATQVGGCSEIIINEENGLLVPPADAPVLASAISRFLISPHLKEKTRENNKVRSSLFSLFEMIDKTITIYDNR